MSEITEFEQLMPLLDQTDLSEVNVHLDNKLALDISDFVKSKGIHHDKMCNWFCQISKTTISTKVLVSRLHRLKTLVSKKRGEKKSMLLEELFEIDTSEASAKQAPQALKEPVESLVQKLENTEQKHLNDIQSMKRKYENTSEEKEKEIKKIKKANQNLEFKVQKQSNTIKQLRYHSKMLKLQKSRQASYVLKFKSNIRQLQKNLQATENLKTVNLAQVTKLERKFTSIQRNCNDAMTQANEKSATIDRLKSELNDSQQTIDYFHDLLQDNKDINIFDEQSRAYTPEYRNLVMNVSGYNVATENINSVINESLKLVGKRLAQTPTRKTIDNIVTEKVVVSNIQVGRELEKKERTTLYSDETRKFGKTYNSYFISDQNKNVYMLGLREMNNKAASTTLDTFKEILSDISDLCDENLENNKLSSGYHILCNIRDFMSDRAKTNIAFTQLLIDYRKDIMPDVIDGWNDFTEEQKNACSKINNFFCGLHLLVNFAECASPALKEFDALYKDQGESDVIGELENEFQADERDEIFLSKFDGQVLTLLRFCAKSFARGVDEKSGCFSDFSSYCRDKNEKNNFISFRGNRFNIIFLMGEIVYYHKNHVIDFLKNVHGANNFLQKATLALSLSNVVIAQCKVLGLVSKLITGPLWRLLEQNKHVLDMNAHYETLLNFLDSNSKDANSFINCETFPFDQTLVHKDKFYECLKMQNEIIDSIAVQVAQTLFIAFHKLLKVAMKDQLPGGLYYVPNPDLVEDTLSVIPHNKLPERAFGMLDFMVRHRPNATILTNEAFVTFSFNKTSDWLDSLPRAERDKILNDARKQGREAKQKFKDRCLEIERKRFDALKEKQEALRKKKENTYKKKEKQTSDIIYYGLWQSCTAVDEILRSITKQTEKRKALIAQVRFRQSILKQYVKDKAIFNASFKGKALSIAALTSNVKQLIEEAASKDVNEEVRKRSSRAPILVGKKVQHTFNEGTHNGKVISTVPGFPDFYNIIYDSELDSEGNITDTTAIYTYRLLDDYRAKKLEIIPEVSSN